MEMDELTGIVIGCAIEVHRALGPGLLESLYESCLEYELKLAGLSCRNQVPIVFKYKSHPLDLTYRIDLLVEQSLLIELKSVAELTPLHTSQVVTYLKISGFKTALLINFNSNLLRDGIKRIKH